MGGQKSLSVRYHPNLAPFLHNGKTTPGLGKQRMIKDKKILITGGAGFIGTHIAERLASCNEVTLLDIDLNGPLRYSPLAYNDDVRRVKADVRDPDSVVKEVSQCQILLHFAAILGVKQVINNARATIDTIVLGTRNILEAARRNSYIERIINISTSEVYGNVTDSTEEAPASIGTSNDARLCYAAAKLMGEHLVWAYHRDYQLPTVIIRPFNIYGPMRTTDYAVGIFIVNALRDRNLTLYGDGSQLRSWCYIDDFCDTIIRCIIEERAIGHDFNIGNAVTATTIYDLAQRIIRLSQSNSKIITSPHTFSDIGVRAPNSNKARDLLNYMPQYDMDSGLLPTIEWYREHLDDFAHW